MTPMNQLQFGAGTMLGPTQAGNTVGQNFIDRYNAQNPQMNYTTGAFQNAMNAGDNASAYQMLMQGGGLFQDAARQSMGWNQNQFANFVNGADADKTAYGGVNPQTMLGYGATMGAQTPGNQRNGPMGDAFNAGQFNVGQGMDVNGQTGAGYGPLAQGGPTTLGALAGKPTDNKVGMATPPGATPGGLTGTGQQPGGSMSTVQSVGTPGGNPTNPAPIPGGQPNYPLDVGSYLNPLMQYAEQQGISTINNSAAAAGSLDSGDTLKQLMQFGLGQGANNFNNAAQLAAGQQAFSYGVDNNDRQFDYNAQNNDRNFNLQSNLAQAQLGLTGLGQTNANAGQLAQIISGNLMTGGQAAAGGTIGGSNAITNAITQLLQQNSGNQTNQLLQRILAGGGGQ